MVECSCKPRYESMKARWVRIGNMAISEARTSTALVLLIQRKVIIIPEASLVELKEADLLFWQ